MLPEITSTREKKAKEQDFKTVTAYFMVLKKDCFPTAILDILNITIENGWSASEQSYYKDGTVKLPGCQLSSMTFIRLGSILDV